VKGVSAVVAVVLLLMITVALSAMAYVWFTDVFTEISTSVGDSATGTADQIATSYSVESVRAEDIVHIDDGGNEIVINIRNIGKKNIDVTKVGLYREGVLIENDIEDEILKPGLITTISYLNYTGDVNETYCGDALKITTAVGVVTTATVVCY